MVSKGDSKEMDPSDSVRGGHDNIRHKYNICSLPVGESMILVNPLPGVLELLTENGYMYTGHFLNRMRYYKVYKEEKREEICPICGDLRTPV